MKIVADHPFAFLEGGLAPLDIFGMACDDLLKAQEDCVIGTEGNEEYTDSRPSIAFISLLAFVEAFYKSTFAAVGNMCPTALSNFASKRNDFKISLEDFLLISPRVDHALGSLTAEHLDFGEPKKINSAFEDLLGLTPLQSKEIKIFHSYTSKRNQLVHHGGTVTARYFRQAKPLDIAAHEIYWHSVSITPKEVTSAVDFFIEIGERLTNACYLKMLELEGDKLLEADDSIYHLFSYFKRDYGKYFNKES